jgi:hypothetical protein
LFEEYRKQSAEGQNDAHDPERHQLSISLHAGELLCARQLDQLGDIHRVPLHVIAICMI